MKWFSGLLVLVLAVLSAGVASAQQSGVAVRHLATVMQPYMPVGGWNWQGQAYIYDPLDANTVAANSAGFVYVAAGEAQYQVGDADPIVLPSGSAKGAEAGVTQTFGGHGPDRSEVWMIGLGGPTPATFDFRPAAKFRSATVLPPGSGPFELSLSQVSVTADGVLPALPGPGTATLYVQSGFLYVSTATGGATLRPGSIINIPAPLAVSFRLLTGEPASLLMMAVQQAGPGLHIGVPPPVLPPYPSHQYNPMLPGLPSGPYKGP